MQQEGQAVDRPHVLAPACRQYRAVVDHGDAVLPDGGGDTLDGFRRRHRDGGLLRRKVALQGKGTILLGHVKNDFRLHLGGGDAAVLLLDISRGAAFFAAAAAQRQQQAQQQDNDAFHGISLRI